MIERTIQFISTFIRDSLNALLKLLEFLWLWSFGQIVSVFQSDWQSLPVWKIILLVLMLGGISFLLWKSLGKLWDAGLVLFHALVDLVGALIAVLPFIVLAGLLAFAGGWIIQEVHF